MTHLSTLMPLPEIQSERARETKTAPKLVQDIRAKLVVQKNKVSIVGIDGPTAAGKTILADALRDHLLAEGIPTSVFRFDWTLKDRESRVADLLHLRKEPFSFEHEAELHMNLQVVENFLKQIVHFNESEDVMNGERVIELSDLYNRSDDGKLTGAARFHLKAGTVIILEGHYTLRNDFDKYIDLNVVLLARWEELLKRKIARVKDYRDADATNDYFWRIDVPSFRNHLRRFGLNADMVVENTDYNSPVLSSIAEVEKWLSYDDSRLLQSRSIFGDGSIGDFVVSNSLFASADLKRAIEAAIRAIKKWDHKADQFLRVNIQSLESDLTTFASNLVRELNTSAQDGYEFRITHHDSLHNVYYRKLPFSLSIGIFEVQRKSPVVSLLADIFQSELSIQIVWAGGYHKVHVVRQLGEIANVSRSTVKDATGEYLCATDSTGAIPVMLPTDFTLPPFLKTQDFRLVYIRKESEVMSPSQALSKLLREKGVWIQRFSLFSELQFFRDVMQHIGIHCVQIANYLIGINHPSPTLREQFFEFAQEWRTPLEKVALFEKSASEMDALVVAERHEAATYVKEHCPNFLMMDGYLFSDFLYGDDRKLNDGLLQLKQMLLHRNRLVRKRATEFIGKNFPLLDLPTEKLWNTIPSNARKSIYLEEFVRISPTILAEVYLWMSIRKERAAILGCNIYDVREHSIDSRAYLAAAQKKGVPIVLQGSLNALGQSEVDESGATQHGYLKLANGPVDFVNAAMTSARDLFLTSGVLPPLFGIGLDHVTSKYDTPKGRAKRFLKLAADTGLLTHYVADGEGLYDSSHESGNPYAAMAEFSAELTHDLPSQYTLDREICAGELNYVDKISKVQTVKDMKVFMRAYQEALEKKNHLSLLSRPMLFIGNLGTIHHGKDKVSPPVETAKEWREALKREHFVTCVLHGTTNTHKAVLHKAADGCHKINLAGEFLGIIVENLPEHISRVISDSDVEPKKMIADVRSTMNQTPLHEFEPLHNALMNSCEDFLTTVSSPAMSSMDTSYFQQLRYVFSENQAAIVIAQIKHALDKFKPQSKSNTGLAVPAKANSFSASMIEVPDDIVISFLDTLWKCGIRNFHIDGGDGKFVPREFSGVKRASKIRALYPAAEIHAHLMIENPHFPKDGEVCPVEQYAKAGCNAIAVHPRAFRSKQELLNALGLIRNLGCKPGIVVETSDTFEKRLEEIIQEAKLDWIVVMGVPIGYGGQIFQVHALQTISKLQAFMASRNTEFVLEADGGLTLQTLALCMHAGANIFAGWSIVKAADQLSLAENILKVNTVLSGR